MPVASSSKPSDPEACKPWCWQDTESLSALVALIRLSLWDPDLLFQFGDR